MIQGLIETISLLLVPIIILSILICGLVKKVAVYETFIDGAKDRINVGLGIIPYLVDIITAVSMFRASGAI